MNRHSRILSVGAAGVLSVALFACGGGAPPSNQPTLFIPPQASPSGNLPIEARLCGLLTAQFASTVLDEPVGEPLFGQTVPGEMGTGIFCRWAVAGDALTYVEVRELVMTRAGFDDIVSDLEMTEQVPGVGEAAYTEPFSLGSGTDGVTLVAYQDGRGVAVDIALTGGDTAALTEDAKSIANTILAN